MKKNAVMSPGQMRQANELLQIDETIARLNTQPKIERDQRGKEYISIRQIEANLDTDFGPSGWSWFDFKIESWGVVGTDKNNEPMIGLCASGTLRVCFPGGDCKDISGVASDFVSRPTIKNSRGNKAAILSSMALKNAAAKLGLKYGRGYFDGYIAEEITDAIENVTVEQYRDQILDAKSKDELKKIWGQIPKQFKGEGSQLHTLFSTKGKQLAAQSKAA